MKDQKHGFKKRPRNSTKTSSIFYVKFIAGLGVLQAYFAFQFGSIRDFATSTKIHLSELNVTANVNPYLWFTLNT